MRRFGPETKVLLCFVFVAAVSALFAATAVVVVAQQANDIDLLLSSDVPLSAANAYTVNTSTNNLATAGNANVRITGVVKYGETLSVACARLGTALVHANACPTGRIVQAYVSGGGALWVAGKTVTQ